MRRRFACVTILTTLAVTPAVPLDRLVDIANDHWVEVTGESSVNAAPDFARVTNTEKTAGEAMAANAKAGNARFAHQVGGRRSRRHPDLRSLDVADVLVSPARLKDRADDHRL
jgi:uncharacterized protein YggE